MTMQRNEINLQKQKKTFFKNLITTRIKSQIDKSEIKLFIFRYFLAIKEFKPTDATTNPSLILAAAKIEKYSKIIDQAVEYGIKSAE